MRQRVLERLPDTCQVLAPNHGTDDNGQWTDGHVAIEYNGSTSIPCRFDPTRQYRAADVFGQEGILGDYTVTLPADLGTELTVDYRLLKDGSYFEVKKLMQDDSWAVSTRLMATKVLA